MNATIFSFLMAMLWSTIFIIITYLLRKKGVFIRQFGVLSIVTLYIFCVIRMIVAVEFPFSIMVGQQGVFSDIVANIYYEKLTTIFTYEVSILSLIALVCTMVSLVKLIRYISNYRKAFRQVKRFEVVNDERTAYVLSKVVGHYKKKLNVKIVKSPYNWSPMGIGILNKHIILPDDEYSDSELYYILMHEYTHLINNDIAVKVITMIFCCLFWWNPAVYLLKKDLEQTLEIKCDLISTEHMTTKQTKDYLKLIVEIATDTHLSKQIPITQYSTSLVKAGKYNTVAERIVMVCTQTSLKGRSWLNNAAITVIFVVLLVLSYSIVIQTKYAPNDEEYGSITNANFEFQADDGKYYVINSDGTMLEITEEKALNLLRSNIDLEE